MSGNSTFIAFNFRPQGVSQENQTGFVIEGRLPTLRPWLEAKIGELEHFEVAAQSVNETVGIAMFQPILAHGIIVQVNPIVAVVDFPAMMASAAILVSPQLPLRPAPLGRVHRQLLEIHGRPAPH
jgi:hypothetical protein